ncbi:PCRF domain-containing protein, partial [Acinetobacter baumannii]
HAELEPVVQALLDYRRVQAQQAETRALLADPEFRDPELRELAGLDIAEGGERLLSLEAELQRLMIPRDPNDDCSIW